MLLQEFILNHVNPELRDQLTCSAVSFQVYTLSSSNSLITCFLLLAQADVLYCDCYARK